MNNSFTSSFGLRLKQFIDQKHSLGFYYDKIVYILRNFDVFCREQFPAEQSLTKEICLAWAIRKDTENIRTYNNRLAPIREFARYLIRRGENAYLLPIDFHRNLPRPTFYVYSEKEIISLWNVLDNLKPSKTSPFWHLIIPVFFRLLYCCGLRPCEARKLSCEDVDLESGRLNIIESKRNKSRIVMMSDDVTEMCLQYNNSVSKIIPNRKIFFPNPKDVPYPQGWPGEFFPNLRTKAGIHASNNCSPRIYDMRHTFATHRLYKWMQEGKDIANMIPYLSESMGPEKVRYTYYYIHFVPGIIETMTGFDFSILENILPEVEYDE
jgi:integrase